MKVYLPSVLVAGIVLMMIFSCGKTQSKPPMRNPADTTGTGTSGGGTTTPKTTDVYICGADHSIPCYWKNGTEVLLSTGNGQTGECKSIVVHDMDVYVTGYVVNTFASGAVTSGAVYWKNGVVVGLDPRTTSGVPDGETYFGTGTAVADTNFFVTVQQNYDPQSDLLNSFYLKLGPSGSATEYHVADVLGGPTLNSIFATTTDIYITGSGIKPTGTAAGGFAAYNQFPCYFTNAITSTTGAGEHFLPVNLPLGYGFDFYYGQATGIAVSGSDIYVCGSVTQGMNNNIPGLVDYALVYWKNDSLQYLLGPVGQVLGGTTTSLILSGSDVYITGAADGIAVYWKNGVYTHLADNATANSIGVTPSGDVYASGYNGEAGNSSALYWKNGTQTVLATGGHSLAYALFVYTH